MRGQVRPPARRSTPTSRRCAASPPTTCPASRASARTATKWIDQYGDLDNLVARVDEVKGKAGDALRAHLGEVMRNRQLNELVRDVDLERDAGRPGAQPTGTATRCTGSSTPSSSGCCATGSIATLEAEEDPSDDEGFEVTGSVLGPGEVGRWLGGHARTGDAPASTSPASGARAPATSPASRSPTADGARRLVRRRRT